MKTKPAWQPQELGMPLPDSAHACSVCLPTWDSVIGYEEGRDDVVERMQLGYPRFFLNPFVERLCRESAEAMALRKSVCLPFVSREVAGRAQRFVERRTGQAGRLEFHEGLAYLLVPPGEPLREARNYWRYTGEILSSRLAEDILAGRDRTGGSELAGLRTALAGLQGGAASDHFLFPSGMAALFEAHHAAMSLSRSKPTLQLEFPYTDLFNIQKHFGPGVEFPNLMVEGAFAHELERIAAGDYAAVFTELPSNPLCRSVDLPALAEACRRSDTPLVVDDTVASFLNVDVREFADMVTSSLTKWHVGHGDVIGGVTWANPASEHYEFFVDCLRERESQCPLYAADAELVLERVKGMEARVRRANESAGRLVKALQEDSRVGQIWYPGIEDDDPFQRVRRADGGRGALFSMVLSERARSPQFFDALRVSKGPSLGTDFTLVCPYTLLAHYDELDWVVACGLDRNLIRVSVGQEEATDLLQRFADALDAAH